MIECTCALEMSPSGLKLMSLGLEGAVHISWKCGQKTKETSRYKASLYVIQFEIFSYFLTAAVLMKYVLSTQPL